MKQKLHRPLHRLIKQKRQHRHNAQAQSHGSPHPQPGGLDVLHRLTCIPDDRVDSKHRQPHRRNTLKHSPLHHHRPPILQRAHHALNQQLLPSPWPLRKRIQLLRPQRLLIRAVRLVPLVRDVAGQVDPADAVGGAHEVGVRDGAEGFTDVGGVGDVALGGEEGGADAGRVGGVADVGF
ncbi:hypothetical protein V494_07864, partial [Pseudogymnoascus sp. VKM F-4513 (FW-928)]